jgi:hypothetical protein
LLSLNQSAALTIGEGRTNFICPILAFINSIFQRTISLSGDRYY